MKDETQVRVTETSHGLPSSERKVESSPASASPATIEIDLLMEYALEKPSFALSLLASFAESGPSRLYQMEQHLARRDVSALGRFAHSLVSVAGILAAIRLAAICSQLELECHHNNSVQIDRLAKELREEMRRVLDDLPRIQAEIENRAELL